MYQLHLQYCRSTDWLELKLVSAGTDGGAEYSDALILLQHLQCTTHKTTN